MICGPGIISAGCTGFGALGRAIRGRDRGRALGRPSATFQAGHNIDSELIFQIGVILIAGFFGALLASRLKQGVIIGYIIAGIAIGPFLHIELGPFVYHGLIHQTDLVQSISKLGIILLIFFVGLEFSMDKIRRVKGPAVVLSLIDVGVNLFTAILLATALGWPLVDTIFLAAILSMSCSAVAMKSLMELGRLDRPETEFMLGMIIMEEFISMLFLTVVSGLIVKEGGFDLTGLAAGMVVFFLCFAVMAAVVIPRTVDRIRRMKSDELFIVFMLAVICLFAALAELCGVPALIGAFFLGMTFAETKAMERLHSKIVPLRDVFVAIFFVSFGMMMDVSMFGAVAGIILVAVVLIVFDEIIVMSAAAYLAGFPRRAAASIGASFSARGGESVMYAAVGSSAAGATKGAELYPIAGAVTFIMSALCPFFIRKAYKFADWCSRRLPRHMTYGGAVISRTLGKMIMPGGLRLARPSPRMVAALAGYVVTLLAIASTNGEAQLAAVALGVGAVAAVAVLLRPYLQELTRKVDYGNLGTAAGASRTVARFVTAFVSLSLLLCVVVAFAYFVYWPAIGAIALAYALWAVQLTHWAYHRTCDRARYARLRGPAVAAGTGQAAMEYAPPQFLYRRRH